MANLLSVIIKFPRLILFGRARRTVATVSNQHVALLT
jgi:hypothetical protein